MGPRRLLTTSFLVGTLAMASGCFNPDDPPASEDTDQSAESSTADGPGTTGVTQGVDTTGEASGCADDCVLGSASQCDGNTLRTCVDGPQGCSVLESTACPLGCEVSACVEETCGDGSLEEPEACDDGNGLGGDGCSGVCEVENGWTCAGPSGGDCTAPDLAIRILAAAFSGRGLQVTYHVHNTGGAPSGAYRVDLWETRAGGLDNPPELGDVGALTISDKPSLQPGDTDLFTDTIPAPANGTHFAFAVLDTMNELVELDENNNVALGSAWTNAGSVVHTSFASTQTPSTVPGDGTPGMAEVSVVSVARGAPELFFSINISHPNVAQLTARVFGEDGGTVMLLSNLVEGENLRSTSFREGGAELSSGTPPFAGAFGFEDEWDVAPVANGVWTLEVVDVGAEAVGRINGFSVHTLFEG